MTFVNDENAPPNSMPLQSKNRSSSLSTSSRSRQSADSVKLANKVFGDIVSDDDMDANSLSYSPSPLHDRKNFMNRTNIRADKSLPKKFSFENFDKTVKEIHSNKTKSKVTKSKVTKSNVKKSKVVTSNGARKLKKNFKRDANVIVEKQKTSPRSPVNPKRLKATLAAVNSAHESVNQTLNLVRKAKEDATKDKQIQIAIVREERRSEKEEAAAFHAEAEKTKREVLELRKQILSQFSRAKVQRERAEQRTRQGEITDEIEFKSQVFRDHKRVLKENEDERRRMSIAVRTKIRKEKREAEEKFRMIRIEEDHTLIEERYMSSLAMEQSKKEKSDRRKKSLIFRNEAARKARQQLSEIAMKQSFEEHESYELKWAGEKDAEAYQKQMAEERRKSLEFRNQEGKIIRDNADQQKAESQQREHESYELKWAGEKDAEAYQKQMAILRRESFAMRNKEGRMQREVMKELLALAKEKETESMILKWAGENDVKNYLNDEAEKRRNSIAFRNMEAKRHREMDAERHQHHILEQAFDEEIRAGCQKDVEAYVEECKMRRRMSLACRAKQHRLHIAWDKLQAEKQREQKHKDTRDQALDRKYAELLKEKERMRRALDTMRHPESTFLTNPFASLLD